jgi:two-component system, chemotaxis family, protein-glutamate methylesterase/glutaminase
MRAITTGGGIAIVQNPREAQAPSMPVSALAGDHPDLCASLAEMGPLLIYLVTGRESSEQGH